MAFYVIALMALIPAFVKSKSKVSRYVIGLLIAAMCFLELRFVINVLAGLMTTSLSDEAIVHVQHCTQFLEMLVIPMMGVSLLTLVRLKPPRMWILIAVQLPFVLGLAVHLIVESTLSLELAMIYAIVYSFIVTFGVFTHAYRYQKVLNETYADTSRRGVVWAVVTHVIMLGLVIVWFIARYMVPGEMSRVLFIPFSVIPWIIYTRRILRQNYNMEAMADLVSTANSLLPQTDEDDDTVDLKAWQAEGYGKAIEEYCHQAVNFTNPDLTIVDVAMAVGSNRTYVSRWFKEQGKTFSTYITDIRIGYAQSLLVYSNYSITEVVSMSGFSSVRTFRTQFVARFKVTPSDYRSTHNLHHQNPQ